MSLMSLVYIVHAFPSIYPPACDVGETPVWTRVIYNVFLVLRQQYLDTKLISVKVIIKLLCTWYAVLITGLLYLFKEIDKNLIEYVGTISARRTEFWIRLRQIFLYFRNGCTGRQTRDLLLNSSYCSLRDLQVWHASSSVWSLVRTACKLCYINKRSFR